MGWVVFFQQVSELAHASLIRRWLTAQINAHELPQRRRVIRQRSRTRVLRLLALQSTAVVEPDFEGHSAFASTDGPLFHDWVGKGFIRWSSATSRQ